SSRPLPAEPETECIEVARQLLIACESVLALNTSRLRAQLLRERAKLLGQTAPERPHAEPEVGGAERLADREGRLDDWAEYRNERSPAGELLTVQFCKERFNVSGKDLSLSSNSTAQ